MLLFLNVFMNMYTEAPHLMDGAPDSKLENDAEINSSSIDLDGKSIKLADLFQQIIK